MYPHKLGEVRTAGWAVYHLALAQGLPAAFSQEGLAELFAGGVLLDGQALATLETLGLDDWAGVRIARTFDIDAIEVMADHELNGPYAGWRRDTRQSFWAEPGYRLEPIKPGVQVLANMVDYQGNHLGPCVTAYANALGGRVVVLGYSPWQRIHDLAKTSQLKAVAQWLSRETLPAVVETYARVVVWARRSAAGGLTLILINASLDPIPELCLRVRAGGTSGGRPSAVTCWLMSGEQRVLPTEQAGPEHVRVRMDQVAPWSAYLLSW